MTSFFFISTFIYETVEVHFIMSMQSQRCQVMLPGAKTKEQLQVLISRSSNL